MQEAKKFMDAWIDNPQTYDKRYAMVADGILMGCFMYGGGVVKQGRNPTPEDYKELVGYGLNKLETK
jgi:hypothetical protein